MASMAMALGVGLVSSHCSYKRPSQLAHIIEWPRRGSGPTLPLDYFIESFQLVV